MRAEGDPMTKMLKPRTSMAVPKAIASWARGCSVNPGRAARSAVVSKARLPMSAERYKRAGGNACAIGRQVTEEL